MTLTERSPLGRTTISTLDAHGRSIALTVPGLASSELTYDAQGRLVAMTRGERSWTRSYDGATGLCTGKVTTYSYDARAGSRCSSFTALRRRAPLRRSRP